MAMHAFRVTVAEPDEDVATALLWEAGTAGIEVETGTAGDTVALLAYFEDEADLAAFRERLPAATIEAVSVPDVDWVARFRESFRAFSVGRFVIAPPWDRPLGAEDVLLVDPGRAFGTGTHETTRLCLRALETRAAAGPLGRVLDVGTGTGLLAVAAARLGARTVVASDLDPEATASARAHARLNGETVHVVRGDGASPFGRGLFDTVVANLTAPLLVSQASVVGLLAPGGSLILSGLLEADVVEVEAAYATLGTPTERQDGEWVALVYEGEGR